MDTVKAGDWTYEVDGEWFTIRSESAGRAFIFNTPEVEQLNKATGEWLAERREIGRLPESGVSIDDAAKAIDALIPSTGMKSAGKALYGEAKAIDIMARRRFASSGAFSGVWKDYNSVTHDRLRIVAQADIKALTDAGAEILFMDDPVHTGTPRTLDDGEVLDKLRAVGIEPVTEGSAREPVNTLEQMLSAEKMFSEPSHEGPGGPRDTLTIGSGNVRLVIREDSPVTVAIDGDPYHRDQFNKLIEWGIEWRRRHPVSEERWIVLFEGGDSTCCTTLANAELHARRNDNVKAIKKITYHKGEGLTDGS